MVTQKSSESPAIRKGGDIFTAFDQIQDIIRERALNIFHDRNPGEGNELSDWLNAESELLVDTDILFEDKGDQVVIEGKIKDFQPEEIEVEAKGGQFKIGGIHTEQSSSKKKGTTKTTLKKVCFYKSFNLPDSVDTDKMEVKLKKGKFTAKIPKATH